MQLQSVMQEESVKAGQVVWKKGELVKDVILVGEGTFYFKELPETEKEPFKIGASSRLIEIVARTFVCTCVCACVFSSFRQRLVFVRSGALLVDVYSLEHRKPHRLTMVAEIDGRIFRISGRDILEFLDNNPGAFIWMRDTLLVE